MSKRDKDQENDKQDDKPNSPAVVITGNPCDGFSYHGPFRNCDDANDWADDKLRGQEWWTAEMSTPTKRQKLFGGVNVQVEGGVVQELDVDLPCPECGAHVCYEDGYIVEDCDVDDK
jgi:hypothetical protein